MFCPNCGTQIPNESTFCGTCGFGLQENQGVQQPQQGYANPNGQQVYNNPYAQQYPGAPVSHKRRNIIIISSVASAVVIALIIVLILVLGGDSFTGTWRASGFIDKNCEVVDLDELTDAVKSKYLNLVIVIKEDGIVHISEKPRTTDGHWQVFSENTIVIERRTGTLKDGHLYFWFSEEDEYFIGIVFDKIAESDELVLS